MAAWLAPSLVALRAEVNAWWPGRDKRSDGWVGDAAHQARRSDHNPDPTSSPPGIVRALDTDEDLDGDPVNRPGDAGALVDRIVENRDPRVAYLIYESRIIAGDAGPAPWQWRPYGGVNPHAGHAHVSIRHTRTAETDVSSWLRPRSTTPAPPAGRDTDMPIILAAAGRPAALLSGNEMVPYAHQETTEALDGGGVAVVTVPVADWDRFWLGFSFETEQTAAAWRERVELRLTHLQNLGIELDAGVDELVEHAGGPSDV